MWGWGREKFTSQKLQGPKWTKYRFWNQPLGLIWKTGYFPVISSQFSFLDHFGSLLDAERIIEPSFLFWSALESSSFRQWKQFQNGPPESLFRLGKINPQCPSLRHRFMMGKLIVAKLRYSNPSKTCTCPWFPARQNQPGSPAFVGDIHGPRSANDVLLGTPKKWRNMFEHGFIWKLWGTPPTLMVYQHCRSKKWQPFGVMKKPYQIFRHAHALSGWWWSGWSLRQLRLRSKGSSVPWISGKCPM